MRNKIFIAILCGLLLTGCGKAEESAVKAEQNIQNEPTATTVQTTITPLITTTETTKTTTVPTTTVTTTKISTLNKPKIDVSEPIQEIEKPVVNVDISQDNEDKSDEKQSGTTTITTTITTTEPPKPVTEKPVTTYAESGISQSEIEEINRYIKQAAQSYGIGTACADCNNEGAVILSGNHDIWTKYSFNAPISTKINKTVDSIKSAVDSDIKSIYSEWIQSGETAEDIAECLYISVYWEKDTNKYWLYLMW